MRDAKLVPLGKAVYLKVLAPRRPLGLFFLGRGLTAFFSPCSPCLRGLFKKNVSV